jgi:peptidoglycan/xylan/chitin deacetylase (PgdA/CDA1 family)
MFATEKMNLNASAYGLIKAVDQILSSVQVGICERKGTLVTLFMHSLFENEKEMAMETMNPQERMTVDKLEEIIGYFFAHGYKAVTLEQIAQGLDARQKSLFITFDDGYWNNLRALPILDKYNMTASVFVSSNHVIEGRPFWWDVLYRIRRGQGRSADEIALECSRLNVQRTDAIEKTVREAAPTVPFKTVGDLDRPLRPDEVKELAATGRFSFENHTANHAVLDSYTREEISREIRQAQDSIQEMTGRRPIAIAYANGSTSPLVVECARESGLKLGFSTLPRKEYGRAFRGAERSMLLGRFQASGLDSTEAQCGYFRSDLMLTQRIAELKRRL